MNEFAPPRQLRRSTALFFRNDGQSNALKYLGFSQMKLRRIFFRLAALLSTLLFAITITLAHRIYVNRQALSADAAFLGHPFHMQGLYSLGVDVNSPGCKYRSCFTPLWGAAYGGYDD